MTISLQTLRTANITRQAEYPGAEKIGRLFRAVELGGEVGEAAEAALALTIQMTSAAGKALNVVKKIARESYGMVGGRATVSDLALELADIIACVDLLAMEYNIDLSEAVVDKFNDVSVKRDLQTRLRHEPTLNSATLKDMLRRAYRAGWDASGEGNNGEHPGDEHTTADWWHRQTIAIVKLVDDKVREELNGHTS